MIFYIVLIIVVYNFLYLFKFIIVKVNNENQTKYNQVMKYRLNTKNKCNLEFLSYNLSYVSLFYSNGSLELAGGFLRWSYEATEISLLLECTGK